METHIVVNIPPPVPYLAIFWFSSYGPKCCQPIKLQDSLKCIISIKKWTMKFLFGMQINIEVFYNLILSFWVYVTRHVQSTQNKKFAYLCNMSRKAFSDEVDFLRADKHENFLQVDSITLSVRSQTCAKYPEQQTHNVFAISQGKHER